MHRFHFFQAQIEEEMNQHKDILQFDIEDNYSNIAYKTLATYAYLFQAFEAKIKWIIKMDDDLDLKLDQILSQLGASKHFNDLHCVSMLKNMPNALPKDLCSWPRMPDFCNGFLYALQPRIAYNLAQVSTQTPLLPLDDIFVTGVLRGRLATNVGIKQLISSSLPGLVGPFLEPILHCPFLGVVHHFFFQNLAVERGQWPWGTLYKVGCNALKRYFDSHSCG